MSTPRRISATVEVWLPGGVLGWPVADIQEVASVVWRMHRPRRRRGWIRRAGIVPWPGPRTFACRDCGERWPCRPTIVAERLMSAEPETLRAWTRIDDPAGLERRPGR